MISINQAEAIFYPAFDKYICDDRQITFSDGTVERLWDTLGFSGGRKFRILWQGDIDLYDYDKIICFITFSKHVTVTGRGWIDGKEVLIFAKRQGNTAPVELVSPIINRKGNHVRLTEIQLDFTSSADQNMVLLSWIGASASWREPLIEESIVKRDSIWTGFIHDGVIGKIHNNLVFSEEEALELKETILKNPYLKEQIYANGEKAMDIEPEKLIREFVPVPEHMYRFVRVRDRGRENLEGHIINLAIAGFVLEEKKYSNLAARMILSLIQMKWFEGPTCCMEGSEFHHVCFTEDHLTTEICIAMGFLGGVFTEEAINSITNKIEEAWKWVRKKCMEQGYRSFMNQGIVGNRGCILGSYFLHLYRSGYEEYVRESYKRHAQIVENYLSDNGHCAEGGNYFEYSFTTSIQLWHVYARFVNQPVERIVPERFMRAGNYLEAIMSTTSDKGIRIPINCGGGKEVSILLMSFMTMVSGFDIGNYYLDNRFGDMQKDGITTSFDFLFYEYYKQRISLKKGNLPIEREILFKEEGLLSYKFEGGKFLFTAERNPYTAHYHEDRGGIVLEARGRVLLPDLGTTNYSNPVCLLMEKKEYHNIACPKDLPMKAASECGILSARNAAYNISEELTKKDMLTPEANTLYAYKTVKGFEFSADTGMLYGDNINGIRSGFLDTKNSTLKIVDEWSFNEKHSIMITYISYHPWTIKKNEAGSLGLKIHFETLQNLTFEREDTMVDWKETPVYILRALTPRANYHKVTSKIQWDMED